LDVSIFADTALLRIHLSVKLPISQWKCRLLVTIEAVNTYVNNRLSIVKCYCCDCRRGIGTPLLSVVYKRDANNYKYNTIQ